MDVFREFFGVKWPRISGVRCTWTNNDEGVWGRMASLGHNKLSIHETFVHQAISDYFIRSTLFWTESIGVTHFWLVYFPEFPLSFQISSINGTIKTKIWTLFLCMYNTYFWDMLYSCVSYNTDISRLTFSVELYVDLFVRILYWILWLIISHWTR